MNFLCWLTDISNIHKSHTPRSFDFYVVHCFNISEHISISVLFFAGFFKIIAPGDGVSHFLCAWGVGNWPFQKFPQSLLGGGGRRWSGLELTDTLCDVVECHYKQIEDENWF